MEESISGFKERGGWNDIVEHGERITNALREFGVDGEFFDEWDDWRPKTHERLDEHVNEKTAEQARIEKGAGEHAGKRPNDDLKSAGQKLSESAANLGDPDETAADSVFDSVEYVARAADSAGRKAIRAVEDTVYRNVMTQVAPYYFDNDLVSANLRRTDNARDGEYAGYVFEVNINDDDLKDEVSDRLAEYEDEVDRWHVTTQKRTDALESVDGAEKPNPEPKPDFTTN